MVWEIAIAALAALVTSWIACRIIIAAGPIDAPNEARKRHKAPTPTSGGVAIGVASAVGIIVLAVLSGAWADALSDMGVRRMWVIAAYAYPLLIIGFIDDAIHLRARFKFLLYTLIAVAAALTLGVVQSFPVSAGFTLPLPYLIGLAGTALWIFVVINAVNFMDGANGLAMGSAAIALVGLGLTGLATEVASVTAIGFVGAAALAGFLIWNFPSGRLFAGDSGALFVAALAAMSVLVLIARERLSPFAGPIVLAPLLADAVITAFWRLTRRGWRSLFVGHEEHLYQLLRLGGVNANRITFVYWALTAACAVVVFALAHYREPLWSASALAIVALAAVAASYVVRRWARRRGLLQ
jgi:UDP-N-acetylmuramyl pentapeptide phosphotransferase/UDP-N-acetylglucosamine-1-phosphate transferase